MMRVLRYSAGAVAINQVQGEADLGSGSLLARTRGNFGATSRRFGWRVGKRARFALLAVILGLLAGAAVLVSGRETPAAARSAPVTPAAGSSATAVGIVSVAPVGTLPAMKIRPKPPQRAAAVVAAPAPALAAASSPSSSLTTAASTTPTAPVVTAPVAASPPAPTPAPPAPAPSAPAPRPKPVSSGTGGGTGTTVAGGG